MRCARPGLMASAIRVSQRLLQRRRTYTLHPHDLAPRLLALDDAHLRRRYADPLRDHPAQSLVRPAVDRRRRHPRLQDPVADSHQLTTVAAGTESNIDASLGHPPILTDAALGSTPPGSHPRSPRAPVDTPGSECRPAAECRVVRRACLLYTSPSPRDRT